VALSLIAFSSMAVLPTEVDAPRSAADAIGINPLPVMTIVTTRSARRKIKSNEE
jgi:hypothetical protein